MRRERKTGQSVAIRGAITTVALLVIGCHGATTVVAPGDEYADADAFDPYGVKRSNPQAIGTAAYLGMTVEEVRANRYTIEFPRPLPIGQALSLAHEERLRVCHLRFAILDSNDGVPRQWGRLILPDSHATSITTVTLMLAERLTATKRGIETLISLLESKRSEAVERAEDAPSHAHDVEHQLRKIDTIEHGEIVSVGFHAVLTPSDVARLIEGTDWALSLELDAVLQNTVDTFAAPKSLFDYGTSWSRAEATELGAYRKFRWYGVWDQDALDYMDADRRPAYESDINMEYEGGHGWAEKDPWLNAVYTWTDLPRSYLDTQIGDGDTRAFTMGTTEPEDLVAGFTYDWEIIMNVDQSGPTEGGYEEEYDDRHILGLEGSCWAVTTLDRYDIVHFDVGEIHAPFVVEVGSY